MYFRPAAFLQAGQQQPDACCQNPELAHCSAPGSLHRGPTVTMLSLTSLLQGEPWSQLLPELLSLSSDVPQGHSQHSSALTSALYSLMMGSRGQKYFSAEPGSLLHWNMRRAAAMPESGTVLGKPAATLGLVMLHGCTTAHPSGLKFSLCTKPQRRHPFRCIPSFSIASTALRI